MAKCHRNNFYPLILHRLPSASSSSSTSGNTFSGSSFRRIIFDAISCGSSSRYRRELREEDDDSKSATIEDNLVKKSEKLSDLLNLAKIKSNVETKTKEETLEVLKRVVRDLLVEDVGKKVSAAREVRLLAKDDTEVRVTLAMPGAIPPLVNMIDDSQIEDSQIIASLYALLNLGIGNDTNKAAIVKAGTVHKMLKLIESLKPSNQERWIRTKRSSVIPEKSFS